MRVTLAKSKLEMPDWTVGRPPRRAWLHVVLHRSSLDRDLAAGGSVSDSPERAMRARQLGQARTRHQMACSICRVVADARDTRLRLSAAAPPARSAVLPWSEGLLGVADRLERPAPLATRGLARVALLLRDGAGPLYNVGADESLGDAVWAITEGLEPCERHPHDPATRAQDSEVCRSRLCPRCGALESPGEPSVSRA